MPRLTGGEIIAEFFIKAGVPYVIGAPGAACAGRIKAVPVKRAASGVHLAEGYYRACGRPLVVSVPDVNEISADVADTCAGSIPMIIFTGEAPKPRSPLEAAAKKWLEAERAEQLPEVLHRAWNAMMTGRRGPVIVHGPDHVQSETADVEIAEPAAHMPGGRIFGDAAEIDKAMKLLKAAQRPVILAGGGVLAAEAWGELKGLAEHMGAVVVTTLTGKGAFPEDHPLYAWHTGSPGTSCGNRLTATADVLLAVGCRFAEETMAPYEGNPSFAIPPTKLIQVDIDPTEIGRNCSVSVGIAGDAKMVLKTILRKFQESTKPRLYVSTEYFREITAIKKEWTRSLEAHGLLVEVRRYLERDDFVVTSPGAARERVLREMPFYLPRTHVAATGSAVAAAIGAKLARPDKKVLVIAGEEAVLAGKEELSVAEQAGAPVVMIVLNASEKALGIQAERVEREKDLRNALKRAFNSGRAAVVDVVVRRGA